MNMHQMGTASARGGERRTNRTQTFEALVIPPAQNPYGVFTIAIDAAGIAVLRPFSQDFGRRRAAGAVERPRLSALDILNS
ncbi:MAG: hypothetical protein HZY79_09685 [Rhodoblastus sp.]|nr:MAG: hypothetical protein HZY79_09685 [Rhodoblastus sp.]